MAQRGRSRRRWAGCGDCMACQREEQGKGNWQGCEQQREHGHERGYQGLEKSREQRRQEQRRPARMQDAQTLQKLRERKGNGRRKARRRRWWW